MPGPRVYSADETQRLIPRLEQIFQRADAIREELRVVHLKLNTLELIWGAKLEEQDNPDHGEREHHLLEMKRLQTEFEGLSRRIQRLSGQVKSMDPALVDFYGVREGRLVFWCWTRGETRIDHWHHIDEGFARRQKV